MTNIDEQKLVCLALKEYGQVGPKLFQQLLLMYGNPGNISDSNAEEIASMTNVNSQRAEKIIASFEQLDQAKDTLAHLETLNISAISYLDQEYPELLRHIPDPPIMIYVRGDAGLLNDGGIAVVGTTSANQEGIRAAVDFTKRIVENGQTVISGLALGIDSAAHLAALKNAGKTMAVLGSGHLNVYPEENEPLAGLIGQSGALVSEYDIHATTNAGRLVSRNRLIAGLARAVLIVQVGETRRGELYTGQAAIDQGKPVFVYDPSGQYQAEELLNSLVIKIKNIEQIDEMMSYVI